MPIDLEDFIGAVIDDGVARSGAPIARDENASLEFEGENGGGLGDRNTQRGRGCSHRTYRTQRTHVSHPPEQPDKIFSPAAGRFHHWPVRWR
jgi:hypothetical protein